MTSTTHWNFNKFLCISLSFFHWIFFSFFRRVQGNLETINNSMYKELKWWLSFPLTGGVDWSTITVPVCESKLTRLSVCEEQTRNACAAFTVTVPFIIMRSFCEVFCTFLFLCLCVCLSVDCQKKAKRKYSYRTFNLLLYSSL